MKGQLAENIRSVLTSATDLSLPFCRLALQYLVSARSHTLDDDQSGHAANDALVQSLQDAIDQDQAVWPQLLSYLGEDVAQSVSFQIYVLSHEILLTIFRSVSGHNIASSTLHQHSLPHLAERQIEQASAGVWKLRRLRALRRL